MSPVDQARRLIDQGGRVHLVGVGGIGMAGVAFLLKHRGFTVSGCDMQQNRQTEWLQNCGVQVSVGHNENHVDTNVDWLVRSTAVSGSHAEVRRANGLGIPVSRRGEVLPALMRDRTCIAVSGAHGKTSTTAMIAQVLGCGYCIGGEIDGFEGVARECEIMVVEADESDGTVAGYTPDYAVITNIEYDHMEHHASEADFIGCFEQLVSNTSQKVFYCADDPISVRICSGNPKCEAFALPEKRIPLPFPGDHNQWNAAAVLAVCRQWKSETEILGALRNIRPIRRRFETVFENGRIQIISDYAHHPTEIASLIQTAKGLKPKRVIVVFQPHRYTRTLALGADFPPSFEGVDTLWLLPVYAASEQPIEGGTTSDLKSRFSSAWNGRLHDCDSMDFAWAEIQSELQDGDMLLVVGAGDIEQLAEWARFPNIGNHDKPSSNV